MSAASTECSSSSTSQEEVVEKTEARKKAGELMAQGKRNMVCGEIPKAVGLYEEALKILVDNCGELSHDCADAYFNCGSSLLELGRLENSVLGNALSGVDVEDEKEEPPSEQFEKPPENEEERAQLRKDVYEAMSAEDREKAEKDKLNLQEKKAPSGSPESAKDTGGEPEAQDVDMETEQTEDTNEEKIEEGKEKKDPEVIGEKLSSNGVTKVKDKPKNEVKDSKDCDKVESTENVESKKEKSGPVEECVKDIVKTVSTDKKESESKQEKTDSLKNSSEKTNCLKKNPEKTDDLKNGSENKTPKENVEESSKSKEDSSEKAAAEDEARDKEKEKSPEKKEESEDKKETTTTKDETEKQNGSDDAEKMDTENGEEAKEEGEEQEEEEEEEDDAAEDVEVPDVATGEGSQGDENDKGGDDVGNFQLAWEHLDLAKVIYLKSDSKEDQLKAAECHMKLGELSMETENHEQAAEDLLAALKIQETHLPKDDRGIAETHYTLGLAFGLGKDFEKSVSHYQQAVTVIEARIASLNKLVEEKEVNPENKENQEDDPLKKYKDEIKDLQELIPEMQNKIEDAKVEQRDMAKMLEMAKAALGINIAPTGFSSTSKGEAGASSTSPSLSVDENGEKKASDIAHLVRKKRKPEDDEPADLDTKKICTDEKQTEVNGDAKKEDKINGQVEKSEEKAPAPEPMVS